MLIKKYLLSFIFLAVLNGNNFAQKLDSNKFHSHRSSLKKSFLKFQNEKEGRVVFLGGSITYNHGWRDSVGQYLQHRFPKTKFEFINAGIPSMGSTPDAFRFERDVLKNGQVDLLFAEAAVNDHVNFRTSDEILLGMEGVVRHAKSANPSCDILIMHFVDPEKINDYRNGKIPEVIKVHEQVACNYNVSSINLAKEVTERIDASEFDWENDFKNLHPSPFGQSVYANSIITFLDKSYSTDFKDESIKAEVMPEPINDANYSNGVLIEPNPPKPIKGWNFVKSWTPKVEAGTRANYTHVPMLVGEFPGKVLKFHFKGNAVGIAVAAGPDAGMIEYSVDNSDWQKLDLFTQWSKELYLPWYYTLASGLKEKKHTLQIRVIQEKNLDSVGNKCVLRYFYINSK